MSTSAHLPPKSLVFLQCWLQQKRSSSKATIHYQYIRMLPPTEEKFEGVFLLMLWLENLQFVILPSVVWPPGLPTFCNQSRCQAHRLPVCFSARRRWILNSIHPRLPPHLHPRQRLQSCFHKSVRLTRCLWWAESWFRLQPISLSSPLVSSWHLQHNCTSIEYLQHWRCIIINLQS